jgi:hypothetical protein
VQRRQAAAVERSAAALRKAIDGLDLRARDVIVLNLARPLATLATPVSTQPEALAAARHQLDETRDCAEKICLATERASSRSHRGRPMKFAPFLILNDLAGMFEDATGTKATRITVRDSDEYDGGPFFEFAAAVWPVVFDNGFAGLSAALRKWAEQEDDWNRAD